MKAEKLQMCRICLVEDIRMYKVTNLELQKVFEKLTDIPFVTEDSRPMLACVFCCTRLKQCCQLQRKCLEAEKLFTRMLNEDDETEPLIQRGLVEFVIAPTETISIIDECQLERVVIKEELSDDCEGRHDINEIKKEHQTEFEYLDSFPVPNYPESDSKDDTPFIGFKTEVKIDPKEQRSETESAPDVKKPELYVRLTRLEDTMTFTQKKTEQTDSTIIWNTQKRSYTAGSKLVTNSKHSNSVNNSTKNVQKFKYKCDICQYSCTEKKTYVKHIRLHTSEKPYKCDKCQRSFLYLSFLQIHDRIHTGEKPYKCVVCQKRFNQRSNLTTHMLIHTGKHFDKCKICRKSFTNAFNFRTHIRTHTCEKPYKCEVCHKSFSNVRNLKMHTRIHTVEYPYKCEVCQKCFRQTNHLKRHFIIHACNKPHK